MRERTKQSLPLTENEYSFGLKYNVSIGREKEKERMRNMYIF